MSLKVSTMVITLMLLISCQNSNEISEINSTNDVPDSIPIIPAIEAATSDQFKIGFNGEGFFKNLTTHDINFLKELDRKSIIRFPGGGDSKFARPVPPTIDASAKGWNMQSTDIENYFSLYLPAAGESFEESCDGPGVDGCYANWCGKGLETTQDEKADALNDVTQQNLCDPATQKDGLATCNYLEKIVLLKNDLDLDIVYNVNPTFTNADEVKNALNYLISNGVKIAGIELGNETYFKINYNYKFSCYKNHFQPIVDMITTNFPQLKISVPVANFENGEIDPDAASAIWNNDVKEYISSLENVSLTKTSGKKVDSVVVHYYLTESQCSEAWALRPNYVNAATLDDPEYYTNWSTALTSLMSCTNYQHAFEEEIALARETYGEEINIFVTEFNMKYADAWGNTLVHGSWLFKNLLDRLGDTDLVLAHNGVAGEMYGMISRYKEKVDGVNASKLGIDSITAQDNVRRIGYFSLKLALEAQEKEAKFFKDEILEFEEVGTSHYYFVNMGEERVPTIVIDNPSLEAVVKIKYVQGDYLYTSTGYSATNGKYAKSAANPIKDMLDIYEIKESTDPILPKNSYGIFEIQIKEKEIVADAGPIVYPTGEVVVDQSNYECGDRRCYDLTISCSDLAQSIPVTLYVREPLVEYKGTITFHSGSGGKGFWAPDTKPAALQVLTDVEAVGFRTVEVKWGGDGWISGAIGANEGITKLACRPATVLKWIHQNLYSAPTLEEAFCSTGNSGGSVQISEALLNYGLQNELDMIIPTAGPGLGRIDEGCLNPTSDLYLIGQTTIFDKSYGYYDPSTGPCTQADESFLDRFIEDSLALGNKDFYYPKTMVWNFVGADDVATATNIQSLQVYNKWEENSHLYLQRETLAGVGHGVQETELGASKISETLINYCKKYVPYENLTNSDFPSTDLKTTCESPYYYLNGNNKYNKLKNVILLGYNNVRGEVTKLDGTVILAIDDFLNSCVNLNDHLAVGNYYLKFYDMDNGGFPITAEDREAVLPIY